VGVYDHARNDRVVEEVRRADVERPVGAVGVAETVLVAALGFVLALSPASSTSASNASRRRSRSSGWTIDRTSRPTTVRAA
jgi:hypothetical protein